MTVVKDDKEETEYNLELCFPTSGGIGQVSDGSDDDGPADV